MEIQTLGQNILNGYKKVADPIGEATINNCKCAARYVADKFQNTKLNLNADKFSKETVEEAIKGAQETSNNIKTFIKNTANNKTFVGTAVIIAAVGLATAAIKAIVDKVKEIKDK